MAVGNVCKMELTIYLKFYDLDKRFVKPVWNVADGGYEVTLTKYMSKRN